MSPSDLFDRLDMPWGWFGPPNGNVERPSKWKSSLVILAMVKGFLAAERWTPVRVLLPSVLLQPVRRFAKLAAACKRFDKDHSQALWKSTHGLWISKEQARTNPFLASYYNAPKKRRGRAVQAWRDVVGLILQGISLGRCNLDIVLDPILYHLPLPRCVVYWFP